MWSWASQIIVAQLPSPVKGKISSKKQSTKFKSCQRFRRASHSMKMKNYNLIEQSMNEEEFEINCSA